MCELYNTLIRILKSKWFYVVGICLTAIIFTLRVLTIPTYRYHDIVTVVYPSQMLSRDASSASVNPCYKMRRVIQSETFKKQLICLSQGTVDEKNIDRKYKCYETPSHTIVMHLYCNDTATGIHIMNGMLNVALETYNNYPSTLIENITGGSLIEAAVPDYKWETTDTIYAADIIDQPYVASSPKPSSWVETFVQSLLFSLCTSLFLFYLIFSFKKINEDR